MNALRCADPGSSGRKKDARNRSGLRSRLAELPFPVSVVLARTCVTAGDAGQLKPGDMIRFRRTADDAVTVRVGRRDAFLARAGSLGKRCAAVITRSLE
jgi:flagellar motor switch protein FliM